MKKFILALLCAFSFNSLATHAQSTIPKPDPRTLPPSVNASDYRVDGILGSSPHYGPDDLEVINYVNFQLDQVLNYRYPVNLLFFPESSMSFTDSMFYISEEVRKLQIQHLESGDWATSTPTTLEEALNRMSALLKSLNGNVAIP